MSLLIKWNFQTLRKTDKKSYKQLTIFVKGTFRDFLLLIPVF